MKTLIIIPAHNEEDSLPTLLGELKGLGYDTLVINDASTDTTAAVAAAYGSPVASLPANLGIGGAVQTGFMYAVRHGYDAVVQLDGDAQHNPIWLDDVLAPLRSGRADCVIGSRYTRENFDVDYKTSFPRRMGMYFSSGVLYLATGLRITDTTSGFRALNRDAFTFFATDYPVEHPEAEALCMLYRAGFKITEVPVKMRGRAAGESLFTMSKAALYPYRLILGFLGLALKKRRYQR
ncbi:glycosyltransferase family 2 protein [Herbaspirillum sp. alder98]|uniref:glycosyltransferase family 2 protein n=1 Tax=Herbaspirillum sp. alder98 TaxID=2913096 RepID=UPI001CD8939D|nr:glycosyltransferase family 2 protein [Herbaspirillum sp. alder98]MCA1324309.1 glycosyltransferase family 2 protein [Herbaspirillum sp. alder98]